MPKRKTTGSDEATHSDEQKLPDSGFFSDDIQVHRYKRLAKDTTVEVTKSEATKPEVKVFSSETSLATPKRVNRTDDWMQKGTLTSPECSSSPEFEDYVDKSPSLNHSKSRVAAEPNRHFKSVTRKEILRKYQAFCNGSRSEVVKGMRVLLESYSSDHDEYIMTLLMEHMFGLRDQLVHLKDDNALLKDTINTMEKRDE